MAFRRISIGALEQEPLTAAGPDQGPPPLQLLAAQGEGELSSLKSLREVLVALELVGPDVPDHHGAAAVLALGDDAFEARVVERVVLDGHREALDLRIERWPLGDGP